MASILSRPQWDKHEPKLDIHKHPMTLIRQQHEPDYIFTSDFLEDTLKNNDV